MSLSKLAFVAQRFLSGGGLTFFINCKTAKDEIISVGISKIYRTSFRVLRVCITPPIFLFCQQIIFFSLLRFLLV
jgi:hypothetical protein